MAPTASLRLTEDQARQLAETMRATGLSQSDVLRTALDATYRAVGDGLVRMGRESDYAADPCPYRFDGRGSHSLIRDIRERHGDPAAASRLQRFHRWQSEDAVRFATVTTGTAAEVVVPGYQETFLVPGQDRPLRDAATFVPLPASEAATPFTLPGTVTTGDGAQVPGEGNAATDATLTLAGGTVTPAAIVGRFPLSRELADASSPAADLVALTAAREDWARQAEARIFAELNGSNGQGGAITGGVVPSGARVRTAADAAALHTALKAALGTYAHHAGRKPRTAAVSELAAGALSGVLDETSGDDTAMWRVQGAGVNPAPVMGDAAAGDGDVLILAPGQLWVWESPILEFRYVEKQGPQVVEVALFGYHAVRLLRPVGLSAVRYTGT